MRPHSKKQLQSQGLFLFSVLALSVFVAVLSANPSRAEETIQVLRCSNETTSAEAKAKTKSCSSAKPAPLSQADKAELQKCRFEATKAATEAGMRLALALCEEKLKP
jgi:type II secretory pathway component PulM